MKKNTVNTILNGERLKSFPLRSRTSQGCLLFPFIFHVVLEALSREMKEEKERKAIQIGKKEVKLPICG